MSNDNIGWSMIKFLTFIIYMIFSVESIKNTLKESTNTLENISIAIIITQTIGVLICFYYELTKNEFYWQRISLFGIYWSVIAFINKTSLVITTYAIIFTMMFMCYLLLTFSILVCTCGGTCDPTLSDEQDTNEDENTGKAQEDENTEKEQQGKKEDTCVININDSNHENEKEPLLTRPVALYSINK